jgi:hypothetical protein
MIFQQFNLVPRLDVVTNVLLGRLNGHSTLKSLFSIFGKSAGGRGPGSAGPAGHRRPGFAAGRNPVRRSAAAGGHCTGFDAESPKWFWPMNPLPPWTLERGKSDDRPAGNPGTGQAHRDLQPPHPGHGPHLLRPGHRHAEGPPRVRRRAFQTHQCEVVRDVYGADQELDESVTSTVLAPRAQSSQHTAYSETGSGRPESLPGRMSGPRPA